MYLWKLPIAAIMEKNENALIGLKDLNKINEDNAENPLSMEETVDKMHKLLRQREAAQYQENERRKQSKKRNNRKKNRGNRRRH